MIKTCMHAITYESDLKVTRSGIQFADLKNGVITALRNSGCVLTVLNKTPFFKLNSQKERLIITLFNMKTYRYMYVSLYKYLTF